MPCLTNSYRFDAGLRDHSGMRLVTTDRLRPHDAGIMELGVVYSDRMAVPPRAGGFEWRGHCLAECTAQAHWVDSWVCGRIFTSLVHCVTVYRPQGFVACFLASWQV